MLKFGIIFLVMMSAQSLLIETQGNSEVADVVNTYPVENLPSAVWQQDGSIPGEPLQYSVARFDGNEIGNAMMPLEEDVQVGNVIHYRFYSITDGSFMAGVTTMSEFKTGWGMKSAMLNTFNGGLVGRGLLSSSYCPKTSEAGTVIDMLLEVHSLSKVDVYYLLNGKPFGLAFQLDFSKSNEATLNKLRPVVSLLTNGQLVCMVKFRSYPLASLPPTVTYRKRRDLEVVDSERPYVGTWAPRIEEWSPLEFPNDRIHLGINAQGRIGMGVLNRLSTAATFGTDGSIRNIAPLMSTLMAATPPYDLTEDAVHKFLESLTSWSVTPSTGTLILVSTSTGPRTFDPADDFAGPVVSENPITES